MQENKGDLRELFRSRQIHHYNFFFLRMEGKSLIWYVWQFLTLVCWHAFCIYKVWRLPRFVCSIYWVCWNAWGGHQKKITVIREGQKLKKLVDWRGIMHFFKWCVPNPTHPASLIKNECSLKLGKVQYMSCALGQLILNSHRASSLHPGV